MTARPVETMCAAETLFFLGEPVAHIVRYQERQRLARRQADFRAAAAMLARYDPRFPRRR